MDTCDVEVAGGKTDAGTYTATAASLSNDNYKLPAANTCTFTISGARIDGDARYGATLTATLTPAGVSPTYKWYTCGSDGSNAVLIDGATGPTFTIADAGLVGEHIKAVITDNAVDYGSNVSDAVVKADGPEAPVISADKTQTTITVVSPQQTSPDPIYEYRLGSDGWQDEMIFTGLTPDTTYILSARLKETDTHNVGVAGVLSVTTDPIEKLPTPHAVFTATGANTGKLSGVEGGMAYRIDGGDWHNIGSSSDISLNSLSACTIEVKRKGDGITAADSDAQSISVTKASTPVLTVTQPDRLGGAGTVNTTTDHEYSSDDGSSWTGCSNDMSLMPGSYLIRTKAHDAVLASAAVSVTIEAFGGHKADTPAAVFTATGASTGTLTNVASGMQYRINSGAWTAINSTSVDLTGMSAGTVEVKRLGNGITTTDSDLQSITVSKAATPQLDVTQPELIGAKGTVRTTAGVHEYSSNGGVSWTDCVTNEKLNPGSYLIRVKASGTTLASDAQAVTITAFEGSKEETPSAVFTATDEDTGKLTGLEPGANYTVSGSALSEGQSITADANGEYPLNGLSAGTLSVVKDGNGTTTRDSDAQDITVGKSGQPGVSTVDCTNEANNNGQITGVSEDMEYRPSYDDGWTPCVGSTVAGLEPGTYYVRVKASGNMLASAPSQADILAYAAPGQVAAPTFSPAAGKYQDALNVTISCATPGATIYYTYDGSIPTSACQTYGGSIPVTRDTTIRAIGVKDGMDTSSISTAVYTFIVPSCVLEISDVSFDTETEGYVQPAAKALTITNTGNRDAGITSLSLTGEGAGNFELDSSGANNRVTAGGKNTSYRVRPKADLAEGTYTANAVVEYSPSPAPASAMQAGSATATITFTVEPAPVYYDITVVKGSAGKAKALENETITITADPPVQGKVFDKWTSEDGVTFADAAMAETTFVMPAKNVTVTATYKDEEKPDPASEPKAVEGLVYNGTEQELITPGKEGDGMLYSLDGENYSADIPKGRNAGEYPVYYKKNAGDEAKTVTASIAKKKLEVTALGGTKKQGEADPELKYVVLGIAQGDVQADIITGSLARSAGEEPGTYEVTQGTLKLTEAGEVNYELVFAGAKLVINKKDEAKEIQTGAEIKPGAPTSVVSVFQNGLDEYAKTVQGQKVDVEMHITPMDASKIASAVISAVDSILKKLFTGTLAAGIKIEYLDITVTKSVDNKAAEPVADINKPVEIALTVDMTGKYKPVILREHGGTTMKFKKLKSRPSGTGSYKDGTYYYDGKSTIYTYSRYFSTYALAYSTSYCCEVEWDNGVDDETTTEIVAYNSKLTKPSNPKRSGYTFKGWYDEDGKKWDFSKNKVTDDITLTAKWKKKSSSSTAKTSTETFSSSSSSKSSSSASTATTGSTSTGSGTASAGGVAAQSAAAGAGSAGAAGGAAGGAKTADNLPATPLWIVLEFLGIMITIAAAAGYYGSLKKRRRYRDDKKK